MLQTAVSMYPSFKCTSVASQSVSRNEFKKSGASVGFFIFKNSIVSNSLSKVPKTHFPSSTRCCGVGTLRRFGDINLLNSPIIIPLIL